jgi:hypothetical protein
MFEGAHPTRIQGSSTETTTWKLHRLVRVLGTWCLTPPAMSLAHLVAPLASSPTIPLVSSGRSVHEGPRKSKTQIGLDNMQQGGDIVKPVERRGPRAPAWLLPSHRLPLSVSLCLILSLSLYFSDCPWGSSSITDCNSKGSSALDGKVSCPRGR